MPEPTYVQRLIARNDFFDQIVTPMTVPQVKLPYLPNTFGGQTPCICVASGGTNDDPDISLKGTGAAKTKTMFEMRISLLALWASNEQPAVYTEEDAQEHLDRMSDELLNQYRLYKGPQPNKWKALDWMSMSIASDLTKIDGSLYLYELVIINMILY